MKVGLYFGTYNPIHIGHLVIANYMVEYAEIDQLWFVVSPQSPHKVKKNLLDGYQRLEMVNRVIEGDDRFRTSNIEFRLPRPSYTIDTLTYLSEKHPSDKFYLIMGSDNLMHLYKWKNSEVILNDYHIIVYPRAGFRKENSKIQPNIQLVDAPLMEISSSFIRQAISQGKDIRHFIPSKAYNYLDEMRFYK